jgi:SAM-dependent methyltransferase
LQIGPTDKVLEIGCGVGRIGRELAPRCGEWHGADISGNMISYARERTEGIPNVFLHELPDSDLSIFNDGYFDCVYSTIVLMHLDKIEMFNYLREAYRVLAPGGRAYFDTLNILGPEAWQLFIEIIESFTPRQRPGHVSQFSTPQEMQKFMQEAGFADIRVDGDNPQLVVALGRKPDQAGFQRPTEALNPHAVTRPVDEGFLNVVDNNAILPYAEWLKINEHIAAKDSYISQLESSLSEKERHIAALEARLHKQEQMLKKLPMRVASRLSGGGTKKK